MDNPIKKIMSTEYKYLFIGVIIMIVVFLLGVIMIQGMSNVMIEQGITYTDTIVSDKFVDQNNNRFYIVMGTNNETFDIPNDDKGTKLYDKIVVGKHYQFTIQNDTQSSVMHIIQVYNDTN